MPKHAYLILAHNEFDLLKRLMEALDYEENDIYIHVDKKAVGFYKEELIQNIRKSSVHFVKRNKIQWGGYSIVNAELELLEAAEKKGYSYYHLLSGADYPLVSQRKIHEFFDMNHGKEFVIMKEYTDNPEIFHYRIKCYHFFQEKLGRGNDKSVYHFLNKVSLKIQCILNVDRRKKQNWVYKKGSQWFSITDDFAKYLLKNKKIIKKQFRYTSCPDEIVLQTILWNSEFKNRMADTVIRYEVWKKWASGPSVLEKEDYGRLKESNSLFARKFSFSNNKSKELLEDISDDIKQE